MLVDGNIIRDKMIGELSGALQGKRVAFITSTSDSVGNNFVRAKLSLAQRLGVLAETVDCGHCETTEQMQELVRETSEGSYDGIVVQLPLPKGIVVIDVLNSVPVHLDIDMLSSASKEAYKSGETKRVPPVVGAVDRVFQEIGVDLNGKNILILGKGLLVGKPMMTYFDRLGVGYTAKDSTDKTQDIAEEIRQADVIVSGIGVPKFVKPEQIKEGAVLIDAGTSESEGELVGDIDPACAEKASYLTPVPGGIGPITVVTLFRNLVL